MNGVNGGELSALLSLSSPGASTQFLNAAERIIELRRERERLVSENEYLKRRVSDEFGRFEHA